ncbi:hypothetical protein VP01_5065g2 [Puccinia sorghi]|uniref:DDE Tnp4 domain-containing protein n=1 Tax=Puccinia sorghi TaxID=27349 RepID=A0A0L6UMA0_9BASI|nr:hypothetical protein VP01_5065g2 [Puccinia sorghi]
MEIFQLSLEDFRWLSDELHGGLEQDHLGWGELLSMKAQVAIGLYQLGHGSTYVTIGHVFSIGTETADKASGRFVNAILKVFRKRAVRQLWFTSIEREEKWSEIMQYFERRQGIHQIVGTIDGTHTTVAIPPNDEWKGYINHKSWASIFFQCLVDGEGNFFNICGGGAGSMHDSWVFRCSGLGQSMRLGSLIPAMIPENTYLIGDAGYPSNVDILVPYPSVVNPANEWFNYIQSSTRIIIEQAFGQLKNQFRILLHAQKASPQREKANTFACMILNNLLNC